jgi:uncharacterized protein (DUF2062 family)
MMLVKCLCAWQVIYTVSTHKILWMMNHYVSRTQGAPEELMCSICPQYQMMDGFHLAVHLEGNSSGVRVWLQNP